MPKPNLSGMNVEALLSLRDQVDKRLQDLRPELEKQLAALTGAKSRGIREEVVERQEGPAEVSFAFRRDLGRSWGRSPGGWLRH